MIADFMCPFVRVCKCLHTEMYRSHLTMHRTVGLKDYYRTRLTG